jgi:hypothetical protein
MQLKRLITSLSIVAVSMALHSAAFAVPYAANVRNTTGTTWEFVLNESADAVTVLRDGANPVNLGAIGAGRHTFDMSVFSTFEIQVNKNAPSTWTTIHGSGNPYSNFTLPTGLAVNTNPSDLAYFGTVYVGHGNTSTTVAGRPMGDGIYALTSDMIGVELANNFAVVADPNDTSQAKAPNWTVTGTTATNGNASPWRLSLDEAGNLIVADWSDVNGGIKYATPDLANGGLILANEDGIRPLLINGNGDEFHGSIAAKVYTEGAVGNGLVVYGMDEDMDEDGETLNTAFSGNHVWKWDVQNATDYDGVPTMWINATNIARTSDNRQNFLNLNVGVSAGMHYEPGFNKWYLVEPRSDGNQGCVVILTAAGDGTGDTTVEWSSLQFSIDNNLDGFPGLPNPAGGTTTDVQDIFRLVREAVVSPDGKYLVLNRSTYTANLRADYTNNGTVNSNDYVVWRKQLDANPGFQLPNEIDGLTPGQVTQEDYEAWRARYGNTVANSPTEVNGGMGDGDIILIPLDANGIPDIQVVNGKMTNVITLQLIGNTLAHTTGAQIEFDAAGNLYSLHSGLVTGNAAATAQLVQVFSPGGNWSAVTKSDGTFTLVPLGAGASLGAIPEPGTMALAVIGLGAICACRRRRHGKELC